MSANRVDHALRGSGHSPGHSPTVNARLKFSSRPARATFVWLRHGIAPIVVKLKMKRHLTGEAEVIDEPLNLPEIAEQSISGDNDSVGDREGDGRVQRKLVSARPLNGLRAYFSTR